MSVADWVVLLLSLSAIVWYGVWKSRHHHNLDSFLVANRQLPWYSVCLSVMATQASAITFLSLPGQSFHDGIRFIQFYFGLPLAMIIICVTFIPAFQKLNIYTAYEFLEKRFDHKTRVFTSLLFLLSRGISTGISIYAPAIVLSVILNLSITLTTIAIGCAVIIYTVYGGTRAVSYSQSLQMAIIFSGIVAAGFIALSLLPEGVGLHDALKLAGAAGKMKAVDFSFDWNNRYNIWSGIIGGLFLQLSYFGTDQSQVGRYLTGSSATQSKMGMIANGILKIPMQFFILLIGILVFAFYQFNSSPLFFNPEYENKWKVMGNHAEHEKLIAEHSALDRQRIEAATKAMNALHAHQTSEFRKYSAELNEINNRINTLRTEAGRILSKTGSDTNDTNYIFLYFVKSHFPAGFVGLLVAVIFLASMGSLAAGLNSLASSTAVDIYMRSVNKAGSDAHNLLFSRVATLFWGVFCILSALYAGKAGNLIEVVNIIGSVFYGSILGIFIVAFYLRKVSGNEVFYAALLAEAGVVACWYYDVLAFLWLNVAGCIAVVVLSLIFYQIRIAMRK
jgi:SSS family transporter